jgi:hypothetical protein
LLQADYRRSLAFQASGFGFGGGEAFALVEVGGFDPEEVGVVAIGDALESMLRGFTRFSEELGEEACGGQGFADAGAAGEQVAGGNAIAGDGALEEVDRLGLADELGEGHRVTSIFKAGWAIDPDFSGRKTNIIGQLSFRSYLYPMTSTAELKFLLILLSCSDYSSPLGAASFKSFAGKPQLCKELGERGWIDYSKEIAWIKLLPAGTSLLEMDTTSLPIEATLMTMLKQLASKPAGKIKMQDISGKTNAKKQAALSPLADRGFIELEWQMQRAGGSVRLTQQGLDYLREDYHPKGLALINLNLLGHYVAFLRKAPEAKPVVEAALQLDDAGVLEQIKSLDAELGTENYLPIYALRQKLGMGREDFDQALYRLQKTDQIELSSLQETEGYTAEQIEAGIAQPIGGPLFFISLGQS